MIYSAFIGFCFVAFFVTACFLLPGAVIYGFHYVVMRKRPETYFSTCCVMGFGLVLCSFLVFGFLAMLGDTVLESNYFSNVDTTN